MDTAKQSVVTGSHAGEDMISEDIDAGRRVLHLQRDALSTLADRLDGTFTDAIELLLRVKGRVHGHRNG